MENTTKPDFQNLSETLFSFVKSNNVKDVFGFLGGYLHPTFVSPLPINDKNDFSKNFNDRFSAYTQITKIFTVNKKSFNDVLLNIFKSNISGSASKIIKYLHIFFYDDNFFDDTKKGLRMLLRFSDRAYFLQDFDDIVNDLVYIIDSNNDLKQITFINFTQLVQNFLSSNMAGDIIMSNTKPNNKHGITKFITYDFGQVLKHNGFQNVSNLEFEVILISNKFSLSHGKYYSDNHDRLSLAIKTFSADTTKGNGDEYFDAGDLNP